jgi:hypothetical protein
LSSNISRQYSGILGILGIIYPNLKYMGSFSEQIFPCPAKGQITLKKLKKT